MAAIYLRTRLKPKGTTVATEEAYEARERPCTCHPDDAPIPCERKYATTHCWRSAVYKETRKMIVSLKNQDRNSLEQGLLDYFMRVERAVLE